jgi:hypothetical protein
MFANVSPASSSANETTCSLQFALRAKSVKLGKAKQNVEADSK